MLGDADSRPSLYGGSKEKSIDPTLFYEKFEIRYDLLSSDTVVKEFMDLVKIFREIKDDDQADELTADTNWQASDRIKNQIPYDPQEEPAEGNDYANPGEENSEEISFHLSIPDSSYSENPSKGTERGISI